jgi:hypothetical protein
MQKISKYYPKWLSVGLRTPIRIKLMSRTTLMYLSRFVENLKRELGDDIAQQVLTGSEEITESTLPENVSVWMNGALARLGSLVNSERMAGFFQACGGLCAEKNIRPALELRRRKQKAPSLDVFIDAEIASQASTFSRLEREGDALALYYTPARGRKMRCLCPLMRQLPASETAAVSYCQCSRAFTQRYWETVLEQPVQVEMPQSALMGDKECKFLLRWG